MKPSVRAKRRDYNSTWKMTKNYLGICKTKALLAQAMYATLTLRISKTTYYVFGWGEGEGHTPIHTGYK